MTLQSNETGTPPVMDLADVTPQSNSRAVRAAGDAQLRSLAIGEGLGKRAIGEYHVTLATLIANGSHEFSETGEWYIHRFDLIRAEEGRRGVTGDDLTKKPEGNSLAAQLTKARYITALGVTERKRSGVIECLRTVATVPGCQWAYKPLCVAAKAISDKLVSDADASDADLIDAAQEAIDNMPTKGPKTLDSELEKLLKTIEKLATKDFEPQVVAANKAYGTDLIKIASNALVTLQNVNRRLGGADKPIAK